MQALLETHFHFEGQSGFYRGKVRDVYYFGDLMAVVATDRISAFDVVFPHAIPDKGRILNQIAASHLFATRDVAPNWLITSPDPNVAFGLRCDAFPVEMIVRGYLAGHAWREYHAGRRMLCGVSLPDGLKENDSLPSPIITPSTKAAKGKDVDLSREEIIDRGLASAEDYALMERYALALYRRGTELAAKQGLILVDTKYEFGKRQGAVTLIDEIHTPDSSRYFYSDGYAERQARGEPQKHLSKEFARQWLIARGFSGQPGASIPHMDLGDIQGISLRYHELYQILMGSALEPAPAGDPTNRIRENIATFTRERPQANQRLSL